MFSTITIVQSMKSKFFKLCKKLSTCSDHHQHKLGALVCNKKKILGVGFNQLRTHTKSPHKFKSTHAEFAAINSCKPEDLRGATLYVYRENRSGEAVNAKPCESCMTLILEAGIKKVYFSHEDEGYKLINCKLFTNNV